MRVTVRYFAVLREATGRSSEERELPDGATVGDLVAALQDDYPLVGSLRGSSLLMVNQEYVPLDHPLAPGDEFALIPPVAGGGGASERHSRRRFRIVDGPLDPQEVADVVADPGAGAIITFVGTVRNVAHGREVIALEYEAYPAAAEKMLARIGEEIAERWGIEQVAIDHRTGRLDVGEASVVIAVASPHRAEAFDACRHAIERIKQIVPIWKKEFYADGDTWIGSEAAYQELFGAARTSAE